ncbi:MAG: HD domain-containing protein [Candidatus Micrarchaeota archaeon]|nr:HD domain-containing protein [Candidatus Micrarchaeota archaeon]
MFAEKVRNIVKSKSKGREYYFRFHIVPVVRNAKMLAKMLKADAEIVEIAAWLHDITAMAGNPDNHHITGSNEAERILRWLGYPEKRIIKVKHCIHAHSGSKSVKRETLEAECVASADAMAHLENVPFLFYVAFEVKKLDIAEGRAWVKDHLERSWNKLMPKAKKMAKEKYNASIRSLDISGLSSRR